MGQFIEQAEAAWKKQSFEELHAINLRMKNISMMTESAASLLRNKNEVLKQDARHTTVVIQTTELSHGTLQQESLSISVTMSTLQRISES